LLLGQADGGGVSAGEDRMMRRRDAGESEIRIEFDAPESTTQV
jgi:hypothetical protein